MEYWANVRSLPIFPSALVTQTAPSFAFLTSIDEATVAYATSYAVRLFYNSDGKPVALFPPPSDMAFAISAAVFVAQRRLQQERGEENGVGSGSRYTECVKRVLEVLLPSATLQDGGDAVFSASPTPLTLAERRRDVRDCVPLTQPIMGPLTGYLEVTYLSEDDKRTLLISNNTTTLQGGGLRDWAKRIGGLGLGAASYVGSGISKVVSGTGYVLQKAGNALLPSPVDSPLLLAAPQSQATALRDMETMSADDLQAMLTGAPAAVAAPAVAAVERSEQPPNEATLGRAWSLVTAIRADASMVEQVYRAYVASGPHFPEWELKNLIQALERHFMLARATPAPINAVLHVWRALMLASLHILKSWHDGAATVTSASMVLSVAPLQIAAAALNATLLKCGAVPLILQEWDVASARTTSSVTAAALTITPENVLLPSAPSLNKYVAPLLLCLVVLVGGASPSPSSLSTDSTLLDTAYMLSGTRLVLSDSTLSVLNSHLEWFLAALTGKRPSSGSLPSLTSWLPALIALMQPAAQQALLSGGGSVRRPHRRVAGVATGGKKGHHTVFLSIDGILGGVKSVQTIEPAVRYCLKPIACVEAARVSFAVNTHRLAANGNQRSSRRKHSTDGVHVRITVQIISSERRSAVFWKRVAKHVAFNSPFERVYAVQVDTHF